MPDLVWSFNTGNPADVMASSFWAEMTEAEGYLEKTTELGPLTGRVAFIPADAAIPAYDRFVTGAPQLVAGL